MAAADLAVRARTRVPMVVPPYALVGAAIADLRGDPDDGAELVDQLHHHETARVLGSRDGWHYVQAPDHYFGWVHGSLVHVMPGAQRGRLVGTLLAPVHRAPDRTAGIIGHLPAGTALATEQSDLPEGPWVRVVVSDRSASEGAHPGFVSLDDAAGLADLPHRPPAPDDLVATALAFLGTPYLWGGTSGEGIDCSGLVQQVYRLNGVGLDRDADQQALEGRPVDTPAVGDLLFFGTPHVTHVALSLGGDEFVHAPLRGGAVERRRSGPDRTPVTIRRYLPDGG